MIRVCLFVLTATTACLNVCQAKSAVNSATEPFGYCIKSTPISNCTTDIVSYYYYFFKSQIKQQAKSPNFGDCKAQQQMYTGKKGRLFFQDEVILAQEEGE